MPRGGPRKNSGGSRPNTGGKRTGAGRKKSATTRKSRQIAENLIASGKATPLEMMLAAAHRHYKAKRWDEAAAIAKDCAPYLHPRLASIQHTGNIGVEMEVIERVVRTREEAAKAVSDMAEAERVP